MQIRTMSAYNFRHADPAVTEVQKALLLAESSGATPELIEKLKSALDLVKLRDDFALAATSKESTKLREIYEETHRHDWAAVHKQGKSSWTLSPGMCSGHLEGQFLKSLISIQKAKRVLEIGMFTGYSAMAMAEALPADGEIVSIEMEQYLKSLVENLTKDSPQHKKHRIIVGKGLDVLKDLVAAGEKFDVVFLDAHKAEYIDYLKIVFEGGLLNPGGTVLVDNAFYFGDGYIPSRGNNPTKQFAKAVTSDPSLHTVLVPIRDGVIIIRRKSDVEGGV
ncbi:hypothetical protein BsWGS_08925 [Bradybaena similaris]